MEKASQQRGNSDKMWDKIAENSEILFYYDYFYIYIYFVGILLWACNSSPTYSIFSCEEHADYNHGCITCSHSTYHF